MDQNINEGRLLQDLSTLEDILIYFLAFLPCVTLPPAAANGPRGLIFGVQMGLAMRVVLLHVYYILSRASEVGSPTNHLGSRQRRDTGQLVVTLTISPLNI